MASPSQDDKHSAFRERVEAGFAGTFGRPCGLVAAAPGRVNLIGEHTDYNDGYVLPMALDREILAAAAAREDGTLRVHSADFREEASFKLGALEPGSVKGWAAYVAAVHWALGREGYPLRGADLFIQGDLPRGAGLSSSAALELAVARAACALGGWTWDAAAMARVCQKAENEFVGVRCGIMDQFAAAVGEAGCALFLDCRSLAHESVPIGWTGAEFVVIDSGVSRSLHTSAYNERREECVLAVRELSVRFPGLSSLRDATPEMLRDPASENEPWWHRARHVVSENGRVLKAVEALRGGKPAAFGNLMSASHASLRDDYAVSCPELDLLVACALEQPGCFGARLTGAGFGGCTISLVAGEAVPAFAENVTASYQGATGISPQVFIFKAGRTARLL